MDSSMPVSPSSSPGKTKASIMSGQTASTQLPSSRASNASSVSSLSAGASASNYDPAVSRLKLPKNVIEQLEKLVALKPDETSHVKYNFDAPTHGMTIRFVTCIFVLISIGVLTCYLTVNCSNTYGVGAAAGVLAFFISQWFITHGTGLTRHKRAYFNERNVLDTYRVNDRRLGHLFNPEPDTPGAPGAASACCGPPPKPGVIGFMKNPVKVIGHDLIAQFKAPPKEKAEFSGRVQEHYGNMYDNIRRINNEMLLLDKGNQANQSSGLAYTSSDPGKLVPANIPVYGKRFPKSNSTPD